ncbi:hypothetical protein KZZ52_15875 [Dactylosporangium sp. AC04546]|uniref:hypothetical protein n=1 Tax=Dactylosporangium sp. AC04546 TaxID=2862460 RepID=UPI001EDE1314|nr:hypothetical protein [Dactylosporangium sp. AC04546]WVK86781.1 hypothetical protein KZZ52_15875 [Dactylosporangium sp. AC04546]
MKATAAQETLTAASLLLEQTGDPAAAGLLHELAEVRRRWAEELPQVALVSGFSGGKTSLVKHWFGLPALPVGRTATTAVATRVAFGDPDLVILRFRPEVVLTLADPLTGIDRSAADALRTWAQEGDASFHLADGGVAGPAEVVALVDGVRAVERPLHLTVRFSPRPDDAVSLASVPGNWLPCRLTEPALALPLAEVVCHARHPALRQVTFIDTAGYGAATANHRETARTVLGRLPDATIVLLDARQMDGVRSREVLSEVWRDVETEQDAAAVLVGLTHWSALMRSEADDRDVPPGGTLGQTLLGEKIRELHHLLHIHGRHRPSTVLPLELRDPPPDLRDAPGAMLAAVLRQAASRSTAHRARVLTGLTERVRAHLRAAAGAAERERAQLRRAADEADAARRRVATRMSALVEALARARSAVENALAAQERSLVTAVALARTRKELLTLVAERYPEALETATDQLSETVADQHRLITAHLPGAGIPLPDMSLDARKQDRFDRARDRVTGFGYRSRRFADLGVRSIHEFAKAPHEKVRQQARRNAAADIRVLRHRADDWLADLDAAAAIHLATLTRERQSTAETAATLAAEAEAARAEAIRLDGLFRQSRRLGQYT